MGEEKSEIEVPAASGESAEDYVAPSLTDLGSFEELTRFFGGPGSDGEGQSSA